VKAATIVAVVLATAVVGGQTYRPPRTAGGQPDLNGFWQALNTAHWNLEPHEAAAGPVLELGAAYAVAFERMETKGGVTILTGKIVDQPQLFGILGRINGLGLELLSVEALPDEVHAGPEREQEEPQL